MGKGEKKGKRGRKGEREGAKHGKLRMERKRSIVRRK